MSTEWDSFYQYQGNLFSMLRKMILLHVVLKDLYIFQRRFICLHLFIISSLYLSHFKQISAICLLSFIYFPVKIKKVISSVSKITSKCFSIRFQGCYRSTFNFFFYVCVSRLQPPGKVCVMCLLV